MLTASVVLQAMRSNGYASPFVPRRSTVIGAEFFSLVLVHVGWLMYRSPVVCPYCRHPCISDFSCTNFVNVIA